MNHKKQTLTLLALVLISVITILVGLLYSMEGNKVKAEPVQFDVITPDTSFLDLSPEEGLYKALIHYNIQHPNIVYAQAVLESGVGKSKLYQRTNNLFGLYDSRHKRYYSFNHWSESVIAYRDYVQYRYKPPNDYYQFLRRIRYASDPSYISKLKKIVKKEDDKRRNAEGDSIPRRV